MPTFDVDFSILDMAKALHLLVKAGATFMKRRGPTKSHKYIWREWNSKYERWDYTYSEVPHFGGKHGEKHAYSKEGDHSVDVHPDSRNLRHTSEQAYNHKYLVEQLEKFKKKIEKASKKNTSLHFKDINGKVMLSAEYFPGRKVRPVTVYYSHGSDLEGKRPPDMSLRAFEGLIKGINKRVYYDDQGRPLAYAMRVNMADTYEKEYKAVSSGEKKPRRSSASWKTGPKPVKLIFYEDNPYAKEQGWAGKFQYFPDGDKLHQFITERVSLLKMSGTPQKGKTKVSNPGVDSNGVFHSATAKVEDGSIGWVVESVEREHTSRKKLVRRLDLEGAFPKEEDRTGFLYDLIVEHLGTAYNVAYDAIRWMRSRGGHYEFYPEDIDEMVEAATGIPGHSKTGLLASIDRYNPYREFEDPSGNKKAVKLITHATPKMRGAARSKLVELVGKKHQERLSPDVSRHVRRGMEVDSGEVDEDTLLDNFSHWRKKQLEVIKEKLKTTKDTDEAVALESAKHVLPKRMSDADDYYFMYSNYDWAIPPDDPSMYRDHYVAPQKKTSLPKKVTPWREFVRSALPNKDQVEAILAVIPDGPGSPVDHNKSVRSLTANGVLDKTHSMEDRKKQTFEMVTRGITLLQQLSPEEMNWYFAEARKHKVQKSLKGMVVDTQRAVMEDIIKGLGL